MKTSPLSSSRSHGAKHPNCRPIRHTIGISGCLPLFSIQGLRTLVFHVLLHLIGLSVTFFLQMAHKGRRTWTQNLDHAPGAPGVFLLGLPLLSVVPNLSAQPLQKTRHDAGLTIETLAWQMVT